MSDVGEYGRMPSGDAKQYRWLRLPWWARGAVLGLMSGVIMFVISWARDDDPDPTGQAIGAAISAVVFAIGMGIVMRTQERRIFHVNGQVLTPDEQIEVVRSGDAGRWPDDTRLHPAVSRLVDQRLRGVEKPAAQIAVVGIALALSLVNVVLNGPWWWLAVVFWAIAGPWFLRGGRRRRASAKALREATPADTAVPVDRS